MDFSAVTCHTLKLDAEASWHLEGFKMATVTYWKLSWSIELIYSCILVMSSTLQSWRSTSQEDCFHNIFVLCGSLYHKLETGKYFSNMDYKVFETGCGLLYMKGWHCMTACPCSQCRIKALLMANNLLTISMFLCVTEWISKWVGKTDREWEGLREMQGRG